jgi:predicted nucleotidyltransferase
MKWRYMQHCCHSLGELWLRKRDAEKALRFAKECFQLAEPTSTRKNMIKGWRLQGQALCLQGKLWQRPKLCCTRLSLAQEISNPPQLWKTYQAFGELYERQGARTQTRTAYASALEVIDRVASRLQDQEIKRTFLSARPVREIREKKGSQLSTPWEHGSARHMSKNESQQLERLLRTVRTAPDVLAVILFGSTVRGEQTPISDVDVCPVLYPHPYELLALSHKKLAYPLKKGDLDIHIFQQLPLYLRRNVLKEGKVVFARDTDLLYAVAFRTAQAFEDFKPPMDTSRRWLVLDRERSLVKIDELEGYVRDLRTIAPQNFTEYQRIEKTREKPAEKGPHCERGH